MFRIADEKRGLFLTFDDGPHPSSTPEILASLEKFGAKATFFLRGDRAVKYPALCREIADRGHQTGNHTYSHPDGWRTTTTRYLDDVEKAAEVIPGTLFRPPYGRLTPWQYNALKRKYKIVMWSIMAYDFDRTEQESSLLDKIEKNLSPGSIVVLHDDDKSMVSRVLEPILEKITDRGLSLLPVEEQT